MSHFWGAVHSHRQQHGHFISLSEHSDSIGTAYLKLDDGSTGVGTARLNLYPADDIEQAKPFYRNVKVAQLKKLEDKHWVVKPNLHFGGPFGRGWPPYVRNPPLGLVKYIEFWRAHPEGIGQFSRSTLTDKLRDFRKNGLMAHDACKKDVDRLKKMRKKMRGQTEKDAGEKDAGKDAGTDGATPIEKLLLMQS